jgi:hypothetical protein
MDVGHACWICYVCWTCVDLLCTMVGFVIYMRICDIYVIYVWICDIYVIYM